LNHGLISFLLMPATKKKKMPVWPVRWPDERRI